MIKNDEFLEKYNKVWDKVNNNIKKGFDSELVYNEKNLRTKIKLCEGKISANIHGDKITKGGSQCICLSVLLINSDFTTVNNIIVFFWKNFWNNVKMLLKKKKCLNILLTL